jgi:hypothetical protein
VAGKFKRVLKIFFGLAAGAKVNEPLPGATCAARRRRRLLTTFVSDLFCLPGTITKTQRTTNYVRVTMMIEENLARLRTHRNNIHRYRRLLATRLSDVERGFIEQRLSEEEAAIARLSSATFPFTLPAAPQVPAST